MVSKDSDIFDFISYIYADGITVYSINHSLEDAIDTAFLLPNTSLS